jgi:hypothetical protein
MRKVVVEKPIRIGHIILDKGDVILMKEAYVPTAKVVVPYDIPIPGYMNSMINKDAQVKYDEMVSDNGYQITLYYNHLKHLPFRFLKIPLLFTSKQEAQTKGWVFGEQQSDTISNNEIPSGTQSSPVPGDISAPSIPISEKKDHVKKILDEGRDRIVPVNYHNFFFKKLDVRILWDFNTFVSKTMKQMSSSYEVDSVSFDGIADYIIEDHVVTLKFSIGITEGDDAEGQVRNADDLTVLFAVYYMDDLVYLGVEGTDLDDMEYRIRGLDGKKVIEDVIGQAEELGLFDFTDEFEGDDYKRYGVSRRDF